MNAICTLDRMAEVNSRVHAAPMTLSASEPPSLRNRDSELYDRACELVEAAVAIRRGTSDAGAAPAVPAVLGCIGAALHELSRACTALVQVNAHAPTNADGLRAQAAAERMERGLLNLRVALDDAETASQAARSLAARRIVASDRNRVRAAR
jgi:hypothetical protein